MYNLESNATITVIVCTYGHFIHCVEGSVCSLHLTVHLQDFQRNKLVCDAFNPRESWVQGLFQHCNLRSERLSQRCKLNLMGLFNLVKLLLVHRLFRHGKTL